MNSIAEPSISIYKNTMDMYRQYIKNIDKNSFREIKLPSIDVIHDFSTNDYLCVKNDPGLLQCAIEAAKEFGVGSTGSRLLSGNNSLFEAFETRIAKDLNRESALIFNSGYQANISVLSSLCSIKVLSEGAIVFFDKRNHASLYNGVKDALVVPYNHIDYSDLESKMQRFCNDSRQKIVVTETLFGMDGDAADLVCLTLLCKEHKALLYLDESHAIGVLGESGYGLASDIDLNSIDSIVMGTFSKAIGVFGAFIACDNEIKDLLINVSPGFIYSTALPPMVLGAAYQMWCSLSKFADLRIGLLHNADYLREKLRIAGFGCMQSSFHIISIIIGSSDRAISIKEELLKNGILVSIVRPPTVPQHTSRLRVGLNAGHDRVALDALSAALCSLCSNCDCMA